MSRPISPPPRYRRRGSLALNEKSSSLDHQDQDISLSSSLPLSISKDDNSLDIDLHKKSKQETQKGKY